MGNIDTQKYTSFGWCLSFKGSLLILCTYIFHLWLTSDCTVWVYDLNSEVLAVKDELYF